MTTNNSSSQDYTNLDDQPTTNVSHNQNSSSQDYTNPDNQPTTNVSHNQQQFVSGLRQPWRSTNHKRQSQPTTGLHQPWRSTNHRRQSQPTAVLLRTTPTQTIKQLRTTYTLAFSNRFYTNESDVSTESYKNIHLTKTFYNVYRLSRKGK